MTYNNIQDVDLKNKIVVIRTDLNVPIQNNYVQDNTRIVESVKTVDFALSNGAKQIIIISHFGRPKGKTVEDMSLKHILPEVQKVYNQNVELKILGDNLGNKKIILIENIRFFDGEEKNDNSLSQKLANLGDIYVNDAFSASHRAHASISGISKYTKVYAGLLLQSEINAIESILNNSKKDSVATIIGGSKVSTKLDLLKNLIYKSKYIVLGGGMANTFFYSQGYDIGSSLFEKDFADQCKTILTEAKKIGTQIILPQFVVTAKQFKENIKIEVKNIKNIAKDDIILDASLEKEIEDICQKVDFLTWNGPLGAFEKNPFKCGTEQVARTIAKYTTLKKIKSIIGGGDVVSAIGSFGLKDSMTYISTGGGAFLEWLEGKELPGIYVCKNV